MQKRSPGTTNRTRKAPQIRKKPVQRKLGKKELVADSDSDSEDLSQSSFRQKAPAPKRALGRRKRFRQNYYDDDDDDSDY